MIGMARGEEILENLVAQQAERLVVALALLILDDAALVIELFLRHRAEQMPHAIAFQEQRAVKGAGRHRLEIIGAVHVGRAVAVGRPDLFERLEGIAGRILRPVEHQMLEQMRETGLALGLVLRPDAVPHRHRDHGRLMVLMDDHAQPVVEREGLIWNVARLHELRSEERRVWKEWVSTLRSRWWQYH